MDRKMIFVIFPGAGYKREDSQMFTVARYYMDTIPESDYMYWIMFNQMGRYCSREEAVMMSTMSDPGLKTYVRKTEGCASCNGAAIPFSISDDALHERYEELNLSNECGTI